MTKTKYDKIPTMHNAGVIIGNNAKFEYDKCQQCKKRSMIMPTVQKAGMSCFARVSGEVVTLKLMTPRNVDGDRRSGENERQEGRSDLLDE